MTGPFGVEVVSKVNPLKAQRQVQAQLSRVGEVKAPMSLRMGGKLPSGTGRGGPRSAADATKGAILNWAGTQARRTVNANPPNPKRFQPKYAKDLNYDAFKKSKNAKQNAQVV